MGFLDKAKDLLKGREKQVGSAIDKVADLADERTGGKHTEKIDDAAEKAKDAVEKHLEP